jgi:hypothetical protein
LNPPRASVRLKLGQKEIVLHAGNDDASGHGVYAARGDEPSVFVVEKRFRELIEREVSSLRDRQALAFDVTKIKKLAIGQTVLARESAGWMLIAPQRVRAADHRVQDLLRAVEGLKATRFVNAAPDPAAQTITVTDEADHSLSVGGACPGYANEVLAVRKAPDTGALCLKEADVARFVIDADSLREMRLVTMRPEQVRGITIEASGRELVLVRESGSWRVTAPAGGVADDEGVRKWLDDLSAYRALKVELGDIGRASVTLTLKGEGEQRVSIALGPAKDGRRWARRDDEPTLLQVHAEVGDLMSTDPLHFRTRKIMAVPRWNVKRVSVAAGQVEEVAERGTGDQWQLIKPLKTEADSGVIDRMLTAVADLSAEKLVPTAAPSVFANAVTLRFETRPNDGDPVPDGGARRPESHVLEVGADAPATGCFARHGGVVFTLLKATCEDLRQRLATRKLLELGGETVTSLSIIRGGKTEVLEKHGPAFVRASGAALPAGRADELMGTLRSLTARRVAQYGADTGHGLARPQLEVKVTLESGKELGLQIGAKAESGVFARVAGRDLTYVIAGNVVEAIEKVMP